LFQVCALGVVLWDVSLGRSEAAPLLHLSATTDSGGEEGRRRNGRGADEEDPDGHNQDDGLDSIVLFDDDDDLEVFEVDFFDSSQED
jgi:hypothetical protein|tara:strand:+ start:120 stop:380 length:261 start_codon:yes stop_codon:yes gene_type:complete